jgi:hypothetical protein
MYTVELLNQIHVQSFRKDIHRLDAGDCQMHVEIRYIGTHRHIATSRSMLKRASGLTRGYSYGYPSKLHIDI